MATPPTILRAPTGTPMPPNGTDREDKKFDVLVYKTDNGHPRSVKNYFIRSLSHASIEWMIEWKSRTEVLFTLRKRMQWGT